MVRADELRTLLALHCMAFVGLVSEVRCFSGKTVPRKTINLY